LKLTLISQGYETIEAASGKEALNQAVTEKPDIIILDIGLPDIEGIDVTRQLRAWTQIPIIILSVRGSEKDKIAALDLGADDYLTKPFVVGNCWPGSVRLCGGLYKLQERARSKRANSKSTSNADW